MKDNEKICGIFIFVFLTTFVIALIVSDYFKLSLTLSFGLVTLIQGTIVMMAIPFMDIHLVKLRTEWVKRKTFDNLYKDTYSTRGIANMLGASKSFVHKIIKDEKEF